MILRAALAAVCLIAVSCSHAPPQVAQVFSQINRVYDPLTGAWTKRLSVFVQGVSDDGSKVFDRLYLINDAEGMYYTLPKDQWTSLSPPGEFWAGANGLPIDKPGTWRALLVTKSGQEVSSEFVVPPSVLDESPPAGRVSLVAADGKWRVQGGVDDYLVWSYDASGQIVSRNKTVGPEFAVPSSAVTVVLYSYDKARGQGWEAGPFRVKPPEKSADK